MGGQAGQKRLIEHRWTIITKEWCTTSHRVCIHNKLWYVIHKQLFYTFSGSKAYYELWSEILKPRVSFSQYLNFCVIFKLTKLDCITIDLFLLRLPFYFLYFGQIWLVVLNLMNGFFFFRWFWWGTKFSANALMSLSVFYVQVRLLWVA